MFELKRNSSLELNEVYFWTATIKDWKKLLDQNKYKQFIINTLRELVEKKLIRVYGFVIMPNHIHLLWELISLNGKEKPHASFAKKTAYLIVKDLKANHPSVLPYFQVNEKERSFRVWQRDSLAILIDSKKIIEQKLDYIHGNPLQEKWNLVSRPEHYQWSSASFYETSSSNIDFLTHYRERF
ncbi:transposase [Ekhidna sp.]